MQKQKNKQHSLFGCLISGQRLLGLGEGHERLSTEEFIEYRRLRARVYIDERGFLDARHRDNDGGEILDHDDNRSEHFGHFDEEGTALSAMRLILRGEKSLPIEQMFQIPELDCESFEVSRFMATSAQSETLAAELIGCMLSRATARGNRAFAVIERPFSILMRKKGVVLKQIGEESVLKDYGNTVNMPVEIDCVATLERALETDHRRMIKTGELWKAMVEEHIMMGNQRELEVV